MVSGTARNAFNVTPNDGTAISFDALRVGVAGNVTIKDRDGTSVLFVCEAGAHILCAGTYVMATGTGSSLNIVGLLY